MFFVIILFMRPEELDTRDVNPMAHELYMRAKAVILGSKTARRAIYFASQNRIIPGLIDAEGEYCAMPTETASPEEIDKLARQQFEQLENNGTHFSTSLRFVLPDKDGFYSIEADSPPIPNSRHVNLYVMRCDRNGILLKGVGIHTSTPSPHFSNIAWYDGSYKHPLLEHCREFNTRRSISNAEEVVSLLQTSLGGQPASEE